MPCNSATSGPLTKAVLEQTDELDELGGFSSEKAQAQYVRDVRDVVRKLRIAENLIHRSHHSGLYSSLLRDSAAVERATGGSRG